QVHQIPLLAVIKQFEDVRVAQRGDSFRFAPEAPDEITRFGQIGLDHFDRHLALNVGLPGAVHGCHAAFAQQRDDLILSKLLSNQSRHTLLRSRRLSLYLINYTSIPDKGTTSSQAQPT